MSVSFRDDTFGRTERAFWHSRAIVPVQRRGPVRATRNELMKEPDQAPLRILCLEDSPTDRRLVNTELKNIGIPFEAVHACNRSQFEAALVAGKADLILSDFNLPAYDGITAHKAARKLQPETPFLIVSGTIGEERAVEVLKAGVTDYVNKERLERLGSAVRRALDD